MSVKLVPNGDKTELRLKGPNVTPGYWRDAEKTAEAFDEDGFYIIGDAVRFAVKCGRNGKHYFGSLNDNLR